MKKKYLAVLVIVIFIIILNLQNKSDFTIRRQIVQNNILHEKGQVLVWRLIHATVFSLSTYMLSDVADVLIELALTNQQVLRL